MHRWKSTSLIFLSLILIFLCRYTGLISTRNFELNILYAQWNFEEIVEYIDTSYPEDATDIEYDSCRFRRSGSQLNCAFFINVSFKAPPSQAIAFAENICEGILYQDYDPFNSSLPAEDTSEEVFLVTNLFNPYYYQSDAPDTILGNQCDFFSWRKV